MEAKAQTVNNLNFFIKITGLQELQKSQITACGNVESFLLSWQGVFSTPSNKSIKFSCNLAYRLQRNIGLSNIQIIVPITMVPYL